MIKILLVDDEPLVLEWLKKTVHWKSLDIIVCGTALNGKKGLELIESEKPQIIITDIRMPVMDGLEMIERTKKVADTIKFIVLSGYEEFQYAQKALRFGVEDYLLKPLTNEKLEEVLKRIVTQIKTELHKIEEYENLQNRVTLVRHMSKVRFYEKLILQIPLEDDLIQQYQKEWNHSNHTIYQMMLIQLPIRHLKELELVEQTKTLKECKGIIEQILEDRNQSILEISLMERHKYEFIIVFSYSQENVIELLMGKKVEAFAIEVDKQFKLLWNLAAMIGISDWAAGVKNIVLCYNQARNAVEFSLLDGKKNIIKIKDILINEENLIQTNEIVKDITNALDEGDEEVTLYLLKKLFDEILHKSRSPLSKLQKICSEIVFSVIGHLEEIGTSDEEEFGINFNPISLIYGAQTVSELKIIVEDIFIKVINCFREKKKNSNERLVLKAKKYVDENLAGDISVEEIAECINVSASYFSTVFKRETGKAFVEYVTFVRMELAKKLLKNRELKIQDISSKVGYRDSGYFAQVFKKSVGMRPQEYRTLHS